MKTLKFKIKGLTEEEKQFIKGLQINYSISFRKAYNNKELLYDDAFLSSLKLSSKKQTEYLRKEVLAFEERKAASKEIIKEHIEDLEEKKEKEGLCENGFKRLQRLKKSLNREAVFGGRHHAIRRSKGLISSEEWKARRLMPLVFYGQAASYGNRFFDLRGIAEGNITFKMENEKRKVSFSIPAERHKKELQTLSVLVNNKEIPVTVKLDSNYFQVTFDESVLYGTKHDIKAFYKTIKNIKEPETRKALIRAEHKRHEAKLKEGKKDRYLAIDLNPDGIGYSILNPSIEVLHTGYFDISGIGIKETAKRKYETAVMAKKLFNLIEGWHCHSIVLEDLSLKPKDMGNKEANKKINNLWNRAYIKQIIDRRCNEKGILKIEINPIYTSFIGNIMHDHYDPIAASIEVGRRGIKKYSKGGFYPQFRVADIVSEWKHDSIKGCETWNGLYQLFAHSGWSYRRKRDNYSFLGYAVQSPKSKLKKLAFL